MFSDKREVLERVKADNVKFVSLQFTDIVGTIKNVTIQEGSPHHLRCPSARWRAF
jgi:glutamine synthetase